MAQIIKVGMADLNTAKEPDSLLTSGLGSCIGICLYDSVAKIGGLAHIMLPTSQKSKDNKAKYADTAVPLLIEKMVALGASKMRITAKIAGGAQMFSFYSTCDVMKIGERNVEAVKKALEKEKIRIIAEDTGGNFGRTIEFFTTNGEVHIRTISHGNKVI